MSETGGPFLRQDYVTLPKEEIERLRAELAKLLDANQGLVDDCQETQQVCDRLRAAIVAARAELAKTLWNGPCQQCDAVLKKALES